MKVSDCEFENAGSNLVIRQKNKSSISLNLDNLGEHSFSQQKRFRTNFPIFAVIFQKNSSKRNQNPSRYYNSIITNVKFQHKPKYHLSKSSYKNRPTT